MEGEGEHEIVMKYMPASIALGITVSVTCLIIFVLILIAYPFIKRVPVLRKLVMIEREELPALATAEYRAEISEEDIGARDPEPDLMAEAESAKYGKIRPAAPEKKPDRSGKAPQGKASANNHKGGKK